MIKSLNINHVYKIVWVQIKDSFFSDSYFFFFKPWNPNLDGRGMSSLHLCQILSLRSTQKDHKHWFKVDIMTCQICSKKRVGRLANFGQCHHLHGVSWLERTILRCSYISSDHLGICFVQLGGEMKCQMPWKGGYSSSFFDWKLEEDEQFFQNDVVLVFFIIVFWFEICS
jgi:hypothetical protein